MSTPPTRRRSPGGATTLHAIENGRGARRPSWPRSSPTADRRAATSTTMAGSASPTTSCPKRATSSAVSFWDTAFERLKSSGAVRLETEGKNAGCWVMRPRRAARSSRGMEDAGQGPRPLQRHRHLHRQGHRLPALEVRRCSARDFDYRSPLRGAAPRRPGRAARSGPTATRGGERRTPPSARRPRVFNVIDVRQSYLQKVVQEAAAGARATSEEADRLDPLLLRDGGADPRRGEGAGPRRSRRGGEEGRSSRCRGRKGLGVKADDLVDAMAKKARRGGRGKRERSSRRRGGPGRRGGDRHRRAPLLHVEVRPQPR